MLVLRVMELLAAIIAVTITPPTSVHGQLILPAASHKDPVTFGAGGKRTLKAIAYKPGWVDSLITVGYYVYAP